MLLGFRSGKGVILDVNQPDIGRQRRFSGTSIIKILLAQGVPLLDATKETALTLAEISAATDRRQVTSAAAVDIGGTT